MYFSDDMKDLVALLKKHDVLYALVGGFAVNIYGYTRTTQDIDFLIYPSEENAKKIIAALNDFGFGKAGIPKEFFEKAGSAIHLGVEPNRIDFLTHLVGINNDQIFSNLEKVILEDTELLVIAYQDLIEAKRKSKRLRDQADADELEKSRKKS
jgi:hypothetical protein